MNFLILVIPILGFVLAIGAATVIDTAGLLGRTSVYWSQTSIRIHHVTKPLIWIGTMLVAIGLVFFYSHHWHTLYAQVHTVLVVILIINGLYLHVVVSRMLTKYEHEKLDTTLLPLSVQKKVIPGMVVSFVAWWVSFILFVFYLAKVMAT